jgi:hypothetical protein
MNWSADWELWRTPIHQSTFALTRKRDAYSMSHRRRAATPTSGVKTCSTPPSAPGPPTTGRGTGSSAARCSAWTPTLEANGADDHRASPPRAAQTCRSAWLSQIRGMPRKPPNSRHVSVQQTRISRSTRRQREPENNPASVTKPFPASSLLLEAVGWERKWERRDSRSGRGGSSDARFAPPSIGQGSSWKMNPSVFPVEFSKITCPRAFRYWPVPPVIAPVV